MFGKLIESHRDRLMKGGRWRLEVALLALILLFGCKAKAPSEAEEKIAGEAKKVIIGGKDRQNPIPYSQESVRAGAAHFQHHCQICHGLDGQNTGVPFADKMNPPVANLAMKDVQAYSDGQLKWIVENGIRYSGMPGWKGILEDEEMWHVVHFLRHLPPTGSLGAPDIYRRSEHEHSTQKEEKPDRKAHAR